jgi:hypothetical protein
VLLAHTTVRCARRRLLAAGLLVQVRRPARRQGWLCTGQAAVLLQLEVIHLNLNHLMGVIPLVRKANCVTKKMLKVHSLVLPSLCLQSSDQGQLVSS